jgi:hypothetical protein
MSLEELFAARWDELQGLRRAGVDGICQDSTPVLFFGDLEGARLLTIGINPSWAEFCSRDGAPLTDSERRFAHASDLTGGAWVSAELALSRMRSYFRRNPYKPWFRPVEVLVRAFGWSLWGGTAAHTDIISCFATRPSWSRLKTDKEILQASGYETLLTVVRHAPLVERVIIFGATAPAVLTAAASVDFTPLRTPLDVLPALRHWQPVLREGTWLVAPDCPVPILQVRPYLRGTPGAPLSYEELRRIPAFVASSHEENEER